MTGIYATARQMLSDLAAKKISARELLDLHVARNDALHGKLNAVIEKDLDHARAAAKSIDDARAHGAVLGALAGLPMTIKDGFDVFGMPATSGARGFHGRSKNCNDADVVAAARKEGAVIWGKTNVPYMLGDIQSYNEIYGTTNTPYDVTRTPGGSSGGAAAALAAGITPLEIGSDIGGSLRHPANFCGVVSLKPTWNVLSLRGHIPPAPDDYSDNGELGVVGPMARNIGDLRLLWNLLRGQKEAAPSSLKGARIAVWRDDPAFPLAGEVQNAVARAADALSRRDIAIGNAKPPVSGAELMPPYMQTLGAVLGSGFPDDVYNAFAAMNAQDRKTVAEGGDGGAAFRLSSTASYRDIQRAAVVRQKQKDKLADFFDDGYDAILMPITPIPAFAHNQQGTFADRVIEVDGKTVPYNTLLTWISLATSLHAPALAVQAGRTASGLPVGVQLVGRWNGEDRLFDLAAALEDELGGFEPPPL
ncbi:MAG TPA: amidase family protein [Rhizomicrobium sp.]|nr:amidase family protein [Rhizomicrobium sp.]